MEIIYTNIKDLFVLKPNPIIDSRGLFCKTYQKKYFQDVGLNTDWHEEYYSKSNKNVLRGLHFQKPPHDHVKLVTCLKGKALDVVFDLRSNSTTYKKVFSIELSARNALEIYIPKGCAHGFLALDRDTTMYYKVSSEYNPKSDSGVLWNSIDFDWPVKNPIISERDKMFPSISDIKTVFFNK
jgi:dTDP-4-dehydrorhamnose 3,5-epimerase